MIIPVDVWVFVCGADRVRVGDAVPVYDIRGDLDSEEDPVDVFEALTLEVPVLVSRIDFVCAIV